jgi:hypothetical protein
MLRAYVRDMQLRVDQRCTKSSQRGALCPFCNPVWPRTVLGRQARSAPGKLQPAGNFSAAGIRSSEDGYGINWRGRSTLLRYLDESGGG